MKEFFQSILLRIQNKSRTLNQTELFVEKPWVLVDESTSELLEYEFFRDGRLLVSRGGNAAWGKWELTPSPQRLILEYGDNLLLLQTIFVDDAVMLVQKSGSSNSALAFVNQQKIPDLLYTEYLEHLAELEEVDNKKTKLVQEPPKKIIKTEATQIEEAHEIRYTNTFDQHGKLISGYVWSGIDQNLYHKYEGGERLNESWFSIDLNTFSGYQVLFLSPNKELITNGAELIEFDYGRSFPADLKKTCVVTIHGSIFVDFDAKYKVTKTTLVKNKFKWADAVPYGLLIIGFLLYFYLDR